LAEALGPAASGAAVAVVELKSDRELSAAAALRERVRSAVARALAGPASKAAGAERSRLRVELRIEKVGGVLRVSAELYRHAGFWQRVRKARLTSEAHGFVEAPIDAELRSLIPPPPLVVSELLKVQAPERGIVALACGALGDEGGQELALISRSHVRVGRIVHGRFSERTKVSWSSLSAVAPAPLREPIGTAEITGGVLRVGLTDRKDGLVLDRELRVLARLEGSLPAPGGGCAARSGLGLSGQLSSCSGKAPQADASMPGVLDALAGSAGLHVGRDLSSGKLLEPRGELPLVAGAGAQLALGDADGDGRPELAYSSDTLEPVKDRLTVATLQGKELRRAFELRVPGISAVTICERPEGPRMAPLALVSGDELWLLQ
jgi:hypothetical protein